MALRGGSEVPVQMTKKSATLETPRTSRMIASSAFLPRAISRQSLANFSEASRLLPFTDKAFASECIHARHRGQDSVSIARWQLSREFRARRCHKRDRATRAGANAAASLRPARSEEH